MASEFERSRRMVAGREVTITSWCDPATHTWSASAPTYCHLLAAERANEVPVASRALAIERVARELKESFEHPARG